MDRVGTADRLGRGLGQAEVTDLPLCDQPGESAHGLLDRCRGVDSVLVVEVDVVGVEPPQRALDRKSDVGGSAVEVAGSVADVRDHPELGGEDDVVTPTPEGPPDQLLVRVGPVHLRGVDEGDTQLEGTMDRRDRMALVDAGVDVGGGHAHRPESQSRHLPDPRD